MTQQRFCMECGQQIPPDSPRCIQCGTFVQSPTFAGPIPGGQHPQPGGTVGYVPSSPSPGGATVILGTIPRTAHLCYFIVKSGNDRGRVFHLDKDNIGIGRDRVNDVSLNDDSVSGTHSKLRYSDNHFVIQDAASANGTVVNGEEISKHTLKMGDIVKIGTTVLFYVDIEEKPDDKEPKA